MQRLVAVIDPQTGEPAPHSEQWLRAALFGGAARVEPVKVPIGEFFPRRRGWRKQQLRIPRRIAGQPVGLHPHD